MSLKKRQHDARFILAGTLLVALFVSQPLYAAPQGVNLLAKAKGLGIEKTENRRIQEVSVSFKYAPKKSDAYLELHLIKPPKRDRVGIPYVMINGQKVNKPSEDMVYYCLPAIPADLLKSGVNKIAIPVPASNATNVLESVSELYLLKTVSTADLALQTGPTRGAASSDSATISCRFNIPAQATLLIDSRSIESKEARMHRFKVDGLTPGTDYTYTIKAKAGDTEIATPSYAIKTYSTTGKMSFVMLGDSRSNTKVWGEVASAVAARKPAFVVHTGDMCSNGRVDKEWDDHFWGAAKDLLATIPMYLVIGNHEAELSIIDDLFPLPEDRERFNWSQVIGDCHFISLSHNSNVEKSEASAEKARTWLENKLKNSKSKFIFFVRHYPAYTSYFHSVRPFDLTLIPILEKYNVTGYFCGHNHNYERSESPNGVSVIVTGGAGAGLYGPKNNAKPNPYSKVFVKIHHFCLVTVEGDRATMNVYDLDKNIIDTRTWEARTIK